MDDSLKSMFFSLISSTQNEIGEIDDYKIWFIFNKNVKLHNCNICKLEAQPTEPVSLTWQ
jgi:hypothetical protein